MQVCCLAETPSSGYESSIRLARALADSRLLPAGELGIFYEDLYQLVKPLHEVIRLLPVLYIVADHGSSITTTLIRTALLMDLGGLAADLSTTRSFLQ